MSILAKRPPTHSFAEKLKQGQIAERILDAFFSERYTIRCAGEDEERNGIDRWFTDIHSGQQFSIQYKTDFRAVETGNVFIETASVAEKDVPGWAYSCQARLIEYFIPDLLSIFEIPTDHFFLYLERWVAAYKERPAQNVGYTTSGLPVPINVFLQAVSHTYRLTMVEVTPWPVLTQRIKEIW